MEVSELPESYIQTVDAALARWGLLAGRGYHLPSRQQHAHLELGHTAPGRLLSPLAQFIVPQPLHS